MERIKYCILILALGFTKLLSAQNPIVPAGIYIADPSAHQWNDGKMYIYGSRDESSDYYCSHRYDVLSSDDLKTWTLHENTFASKGENDQVNYSDDFLYAPDCQYKDGLYYLYYCLANNTKTEGVAISKSPEGPFIGGKNIELAGYNEIDPAVFMDDDGQAYYIWGSSIGRINVPSNSGSNEAKTFTCKIKPTDGIHAVWLKFWGTPDDTAYIDWLTFF